MKQVSPRNISRKGAKGAKFGMKWLTTKDTKITELKEM
jgi:hypothetical protein